MKRKFKNLKYRKKLMVREGLMTSIHSNIKTNEAEPRELPSEDLVYGTHTCRSWGITKYAGLASY